LNAWETRYDAQIVELEPRLIAMRRHLHAHPEASGEEFETSRYIAEQLREAGVPVRVGRDGLGVIADVTIGRPADDQPLIAIRADIDALRMPDEKTVEYRSQHPDLNHACGHDAHTGIVLGAALASMGVQREVLGDMPDSGVRLRLIFQPAEETSEGAVWMVEQGALEGVDSILALHVDPERPVGQVGIRYGVLTANCDEVDITVEGSGGHAARPHHAVDPILASAHLVSALYQFLPRAVDSRNPSVFTIGQVTGGYAPNVIPPRVELRGTLRTTDRHSRDTLRRRIAEIVAGVEQTGGTTIGVTFHSALGAVDNHPRISAALEEAARRIVGPENIQLIDRPSMGGEDFAVYLEHVPGAMLRLGCAPPGGACPFLHSTVFDLDERAIALGTRILIRAALLLSIGRFGAS
jgi:amidohydrolase